MESTVCKTMAQLVERQYENRKVRGIFEPQKMKADHVTKSFMICGQIKRDERGGACSVLSGDEK